MLKDMLRRLICRHEWNYYCFNIPTTENTVITLGFKDCHKCAAWKVNFIFGNGR